MSTRATYILALAGILAGAPDAMAQLKTTGSVSFGLFGSEVNSLNAFRFEEYRDLRSGATFGADITGESDTHYLRFFGENIGRDDQFLEFKGGRYGAYKFSVYNNDIVHNLTFGARTPYTLGIGSNQLSFTGAAPAAAAAWTRFDYGIQHKNVGGTFEQQATANMPFYFRATANQKETEGVRPLGQSINATGGPMIELPAPVHTMTYDASAEAGYATKTRIFSVNVAYSKFVDQNDVLNWRIPNSAAVLFDQSTLTADNQQWKVGLNAVWKQLPLDSTLAFRGTYSTLSNDLPVRTTFRSGATGGTLNTAVASSPVFSGDVHHETFAASWTALPARGLDTRLYYNFDEKKNNSTQIVFTAAGACDTNPVTGVALTTCTNEAFHYKKHNAGIDAGYRINPENKVSGGWDYTDTTRERIDFEETKDNKLYVEWKNSSFDMVGTKVKYQHLQRRSDFGYAGVNPAANANNFFNFFVRRYDLNDNDQDLLKLVLDATPAPFVDLGAEFILKNNNYRNVTLGRSNDKRQELYLTGSFGDPKRFRITTFFDYEQTQYNSGHWQGTTNASLAPLPAPPATSTSFLWTGRVKDKNYVVGIGADWPYSERLKFNASLIWQETDGTVDFASNGFNISLIPIGAYDSFRKTALNLKGTYAIDKNWDVTLGAAYEDYKFQDAQLDGYNYTQGGNFLSGAYAYPSYNARIGYVTFKYKFQ